MKFEILLIMLIVGSLNQSFGQKERNMILPEKTRSVKLNNYDVLMDSSTVVVFVKVLVSPNGKVQQAVVDLQRSTTDDAELIGISLKSAYEGLFDPSYSDKDQWGSIVFNYRLGTLTNHVADMVQSSKEYSNINERTQGYWQSLKDEKEELKISGLEWTFIYTENGRRDEVLFTIDENKSNDEKIVLKNGRNKVEVFEVLGLNHQYLSLLNQETKEINNYKKLSDK